MKSKVSLKRSVERYQQIQAAIKKLVNEKVEEEKTPGGRVPGVKVESEES